MLHIQTVVFATDDSPAAHAARPVGESLAQRHHAAFHVLRVEIAPRLSDSRPPPDLTVNGVTEATRRAPDVVGAIVDYADEVSADVVVIGTHGRTGWRRRGLGSVAEGVLRRAPCAVLTVGPNADASASGPILAPLSFDSSSDAVLETAAAVAAHRGTCLVALHVVETVDLPVPYGITIPPVDSLRVQMQVEDTLTRWAAGVADVPTSVEVRFGGRDRLILETAAEQHASVIVLGTQARRGLDRWLVSSVAEAVVREAGCPVLTLRTGVRSLVRLDGDEELLPVARDDWPALFDALSAHAADVPHTVTVYVVSPSADGCVLDDAPLFGVTYDPQDDTVDVLTASGSHRAMHPFAVRTAAGPWSLLVAQDTESPGPWVVEVVRADGTRERILFGAAVAEDA